MFNSLKTYSPNVSPYVNTGTLVVVIFLTDTNPTGGLPFPDLKYLLINHFELPFLRPTKIFKPNSIFGYGSL